LMEVRNGTVLNDTIMSLTSPRDFTYPIFAITYFIIFGTILISLADPEYILKGVQAYSLVFFIRLITIYCFPLNPPNGIIELHDPIIQWIMGDTTPVNKDLFFSGHTSSLFIMFFISRKRIWKVLCFLAAITVPVLLVWQRVHYTIDVLFAPIAAYLCWWLVNAVHEKTSFGLDAVFAPVSEDK